MRAMQWGKVCFLPWRPDMFNKKPIWMLSQTGSMNFFFFPGPQLGHVKTVHPILDAFVHLQDPEATEPLHEVDW